MFEFMTFNILHMSVRLQGAHELRLVVEQSSWQHLELPSDVKIHLQKLASSRPIVAFFCSYQLVGGFAPSLLEGTGKKIGPSTQLRTSFTSKATTGLSTSDENLAS